MSWKNLTDVSQLEEIKQASATKPVVIFKHSTRCSISSMAKRVLDSEYNDELSNQFDFFYLDLIAHRDISNQIANTFNVEHESPQILLISNGQSIYDASHGAITLDKVQEALA